MTDVQNGRAHVESGLSLAALMKALAQALVWLAGLASTIYLVVQAFVMLFFAVGFINHATPDFTWGKVEHVALSAAPLCCFAAIGFVGLRFWPFERFRLLGLSAIVVQTAAAIFFYTSPEGLLHFFRLASMGLTLRGPARAGGIRTPNPFASPMRGGIRTDRRNRSG